MFQKASQTACKTENKTQKFREVVAGEELEPENELSLENDRVKTHGDHIRALRP